MKLNFDTPSQVKSRTIRYSIYIVVALMLAIVKSVLLDFIAIGSITPDLILILVVWVTLKEGQFIGLYFGFIFGLIFDFISLDVPGTNALTKTIVALIAGWFYKENQATNTIGSYKFLIIVLITSIAHNLVYNIFYIKPTQMSYVVFFLKYGTASSLYTTMIAVLVMFAKIRSKGYR